MQITQTKKDKLSHSYNVVIPASDINDAIDTRLQEIGKTIKLDGFRPGKVPLNVLRSKFRKEVLAEILQKMADEAGQTIIKDYKLEAATQPQMALDKFDDGQALEFSVTIDLVPEFEIKDLHKISAEKLTVKVDEAEIDTMLQSLAEDAGDSKPLKEKRKTKIGDSVDMDFKGFKDDEPFQGGEAKGFKLKLGSNQMIPGFEEAIIGKDIGEIFRFKVTFPENYNSPDLAGQETEFEITINHIEEIIPKAIDDKLAENYGQKDLAGLKSALTDRLTSNYRPIIDRITKRKIFDALEKIYNFELPENLVNREFASIWQQFEQLKQAGQLDPEDVDVDEKKLQKEYRMIAARRLRMAFFVDKFAKMNDIIATEQEIDQLIRMEANRNPENAQEILNFYKNNPAAKQNLASPILEEKSITILMEQITTTDRAVTPEELSELDDDGKSKKDGKKSKPSKETKSKENTKKKKAK